MKIEELEDQAMKVMLYPWEDDFAERIGTGRDFQNRGKHDRRSYRAESLMADNRLANVHGAVAEIGTARLIGGYCYGAVWHVDDHYTHSNLPDILWGTLHVEVKNRRTGRTMPVDKKDAVRNVLVLWAETRLAAKLNCVCEMCGDKAGSTGRVRLLGGGFAGDLWPLGSPYNGDGNRVGVPPEAITPIRELLLRLN
jgi:hypothetical protein